jgi:hypothetical protein
MQSSENKTKRTRKITETPKAISASVKAAGSEQPAKLRRAPSAKKSISETPLSVVVRNATSKAIEPKSEPVPLAASAAAAATHSFSSSSTRNAGCQLDHGHVAMLAYSYWESRGFRGGSPEDDWRRAEAELQAP